MSEVKETITDRRASMRVSRMISGELGEREAQELALLTAGDLEREASLQTLHTLADIDQLLDDPELLRIAAEPAPVSGSKRHWKAVSVAAAVVLSVGVAMMTMFDSQQGGISDIKRYVTRVGEQKTITLEDGSVLNMNTSSEVLVDFTDSRRQLVLNRGEVFFDVERDASRPFSVTVESQSVTVLGTEFNILKKPGAFTLSVVEGLVAVHERSEESSSGALALQAETGQAPQVIENPGQRLVHAGIVAHFDQKRDQVSAYRPEEIERKLRWRKGMLRFEDEPLSEVVKELNRYTAKKILIEDTSVMNLEVYAVFKVDRVNMALADLEKTMPIRVVTYFDRIVIEADK